MHGHLKVKFITMHGHLNVKFITMHGHLNVKFTSNLCCYIKYQLPQLQLLFIRQDKLTPTLTLGSLSVPYVHTGYASDTPTCTTLPGKLPVAVPPQMRCGTECPQYLQLLLYDKVARGGAVG